MTDVEGRAQHPELVEQLDRRPAVLAHGLVELDDAVRGVRRHRQPQLVGLLARRAQELEAAGLQLARHEDALDEPGARAVVPRDPLERAGELAPAVLLVHDALQPPVLVADPAARVVAGPEIAAHPELQALLLERFLDQELAAVLDEGRDAVAQQLRDGEERVELPLALRAGLVGTEIAHVAVDPRAFLRHADLEERLAEVVAAARVADQPVRSAVTGVDVRVDEARCDELAARRRSRGRRGPRTPARRTGSRRPRTRPRGSRSRVWAPRSWPTTQPPRILVRTARPQGQSGAPALDGMRALLLEIVDRRIGHHEALEQQRRARVARASARRRRRGMPRATARRIARPSAAVATIGGIGVGSVDSRIRTCPANPGSPSRIRSWQ